MKIFYSFQTRAVAIPLEQGLFFNMRRLKWHLAKAVAIPLEQGLFFNQVYIMQEIKCPRRNPFGAGTIF